MALENHTLLSANAVVLIVMALALWLAGRSRPDQTYWRSWWLGNILLAAALVGYIFENRLPPFFVAAVPNGLLVAGFALRLRAARQFGGRSAPLWLVAAPSAIFVALCAMPWIAGSYASVYTLANFVLAALAGAAAFEFWRDRLDGSPSRYGLVAAYSLMACSFAARIGQGVIQASTFDYHLPLDEMLTAHLIIALFYTTASGALGLSVAYERSAANLARAASHDPLTGLLNRRAFEDMLQHARHPNRPMSLLLVDIDHFKHINDSYGHAAGDAALRHCAQLLSGALQQNDVAARFGGEEFVIILGDTSPAHAHRRTEHIRDLIGRTPAQVEGTAIPMTVSIGISHASSEDFDLATVMRVADRGLYAAKQSGRNRISQAAA